MVCGCCSGVQGWQWQNKNRFLTPLNNNYTLSAYHTTTIGNQTKDYIVKNKRRTVTSSSEEDLELRAQQLTRSLMMSVGTDSKQNTYKITCFFKRPRRQNVCTGPFVINGGKPTGRLSVVRNFQTPFWLEKYKLCFLERIYRNGVMSRCLRIFCYLGAQLLSPLGSKIILRNTKTTLPWSKIGQI